MITPTQMAVFGIGVIVIAALILMRKIWKNETRTYGLPIPPRVCPVPPSPRYSGTRVAAFFPESPDDAMDECANEWMEWNEKDIIVLSFETSTVEMVCEEGTIAKIAVIITYREKLPPLEEPADEAPAAPLEEQGE